MDEKPRVAFDELDAIPSEMRERPQWVCWKAVKKRRKDGTSKVDKVPLRPDGTAASTSDPSTWGTFEEIVAAWKSDPRTFAGVGYVLGKGDPFVGVDFDGCLKDGEVLSWARDWLDKLAGAYVEESQSGTGLHAFVRGWLSGSGGSRKVGEADHTAIEVYDDRRFLVMTGRVLGEIPPVIANGQAVIEELYKWVKERPSKPAATQKPVSTTTSPVIADRDERVRRARQYLAKVPPAIEEQDGSKATMWACGVAAVGFDLSDDEAFIALQDWNAGCNPPWPEEGSQGLRRKIAEARRKTENTVGWLLNEPPPRGGMPAAPRSNGRESLSDRPSGGVPPDGHPPAESDRDPDAILTFSNYDEVETERGVSKRPLMLPQLDARLEEIAGDWPKRVGDLLFVEADDFKPRYLRNPAALFAWLDRRCYVTWTKGGGFISQERFFEDRRAQADGYRAIESLPHFPPVEGVYYMHRPVPQGNGAALERLLDFYCPLTPLDRLLIKAMVMTWFWGGAPGRRPVFAIEGPEHDKERGRGVGKSFLVEGLAYGLMEGLIDVGTKEQDMETIKTRLLSNESGRKRVALIDNLKTHKFSWAELEGFITNEAISGRAMYVGNADRPNLLNWAVTVNGCRLSKDMAVRSIMIRLARPEYTPDWEESVRRFIRDNRWAIIADVRDALGYPTSVSRATSRWATWERDVLGRLPNPEDLQTLIASRQKDCDVDDEEQGGFVDHFCKMLEERGYDVETCKVLVPNALVYEWLQEATLERRNANQATGYLLSLGIPGFRKTRQGRLRGWEWTGEKCHRVQAELIRERAWAGAKQGQF